MRSDQGAKAAEAVARAGQRISEQSVVSRRALALAGAVVKGEGVEQALGWFEEQGYRRLTAQWRSLVPGSP